MNFSDTDLMILEQLTYLNGDACKLANVTATQVTGETIGERLSVFTEGALKTLEDSGSEGQQWAAIIRYIQGNEEMCALVQGERFTDGEGNTLATAYYNPQDPDSAIVTFNGTSTAENWYDNGTGLGVSDTDTQTAALEYVNSLPYDNISVVGHSKGGNLAQYVTITSDKVDRCVSMDGQGFSQEFIDKYWAEINLNGDKITNYSLSTDFVHILLYPIPNAKQDYCTGDRVDNPVENHYSNSFFQYETVTVDGEEITVLKTDENGQPVIYNNQAENEMMTYLHEFTCFVLATMPEDERVKMGEYIGNILMIASTTPEDVLNYVMSDKEMLSKLIAYVIKYMETYNLSEEEVRALLSMLGLDEIVNQIDEAIAEHPLLTGIVIGTAGNVIESVFMFFLKQLADGKDDKIIETILGWISPEAKEIWQGVEEEYTKIPAISADANKNAQVRQGREFQYTQTIYNDLINVCNRIIQSDAVNISQWSDYSSYKWYSKLFISVFIAGINAYNEKLIGVVNTAKAKVEATFQEMSEIDRLYANKVDEQISAVNVLVLSLR
ncbi:MAG: DUF2974 domain-containing protein [Oscillospiraceae bacterium]|nr:DUF2974 domain-containing protein [Oscillospiraceae bacterium]